MNKKYLIFGLFIILSILSCEPDKAGKDITDTTDGIVSLPQALVDVDQLLAELAGEPQKLSASSDKPSDLTGQMGTIIHIDPKALETVDGTALGKTIEVELLEMTDKSSLLLHNAPTVSNGKLLETGGAYYLNMTSDGKQLKMKSNKALQIEFPKLTDKAMELFTGEKDAMGKINWLPTKESFNRKDLVAPKKPKAPSKAKPVKKSSHAVNDIFAYIDEDWDSASDEEREKYFKEKAAYEVYMKEYEINRKTYERIELRGFGWINCDRFLKEKVPLVNIKILSARDTLASGRYYAIFEDINSLMMQEFWAGRSEKPSFVNIPRGKNIRIIGISFQKGKSLYFEKVINTASEQEVRVDFTEMGKSEIKERLANLN